MQQIQILVRALDYIEGHLTEPIRTEEVAAACYCSKSSLEKLFKCLNSISVHDYVLRRKMTYAGRFLLEHRELTVLDVAVLLGYSGNEAFTRAFQSVWNDTPSRFRKKQKTAELFPRYAGYVQIGEGDAKNMMRKNIDVSELYDLFIARRGCYFVCTDIQNMDSINEVAWKAGDLAIIEAMHRVENAVGDKDYVFRIGGDEFVVVTGSESQAYADAIKEKILTHNGEPIVYENRELPLSLYCTVVKLEGDEIRYKELFDKLHDAIHKSKKN